MSSLTAKLIVLDKKGRTHFGALQNYDRDSSGVLRYYIFDMLYLNGLSMLALPLVQRKSLIPEIMTELPAPSPVRYCDHVVGTGQKFYEQAMQDKMEGIIAKKTDSLYRPGIRSEQWLKIKAVVSEEAIICGYTDSTAGGSSFRLTDFRHVSGEPVALYRQLRLGIFEPRAEKAAAYVRHFLHARLHLLKRPIPLRGRTPHWVRPKLVCEVKFSEWTDSGRLRHPVYKGLRTDKKPGEIRLVAGADHPDINSKARTRILLRRALKVDNISVPISNLGQNLLARFRPAQIRSYRLLSAYCRDHPALSVRPAAESAPTPQRHSAAGIFPEKQCDAAGLGTDRGDLLRIKRQGYPLFIVSESSNPALYGQPGLHRDQLLELPHRLA